MDIDKTVRGPFRWLTIAFILFVISLAGLLIIFDQKDSGREFSEAIELLTFLTLAISWATYLLILGRLARKLNKSPTIWVGLTWAFTPFAPLFSYFMMWSAIRSNKELST